ncbi:MAG: glycosyltransferase family 39 protein [Candidatus Micrarchaeaceae archaeon]
MKDKPRIESQHTHNSIKGIDRNSEKKSAKIAYIALVLILIYFITYLSTHPMAPSFFDDDTAYEMLAYDVVHGTFYPTTNYYYTARIMQVLPMSIFYLLFGINFLSSAMWDIIASSLIIIITFYSGRDIYNEYVGVIAALILSVFPLMVYLSGTSKETIPMALFTTLAFYGAMKGYLKNSSKWYFVSGLSIIAAFLASLLGIIIAVTILVYVIILAFYQRHKKEKRVSLKSVHILSGAIFGIALILLYGFLASNNPFIIFQINIEYITVPSYTHFSVITPYYAILLPPFFDALSGINIGYIFYVFYIAIPYLLIKRVKKSYTAIFWALFTLLYLWVGPMKIGMAPFSYSMIPRGWQYLPIIAPPVAITIAAFLVNIYESYGKKHLVPTISIISAVIVFIVYSSLYLDITAYYGYLNQMLPIFDLANYLNTMPNTTTIYMPLQIPDIEEFMLFNNISRFIYYNLQVPNCSVTKNYDYVITMSGLPNSSMVCPSWTEVYFPENRLLPQYSKNYIKLYKVNR